MKDEQSYKKGMKVLMDRVAPLITSHSAEGGLNFSMAPHKIEKEKKAIAFRIKVEESTGRYEKTQMN